MPDKPLFLFVGVYANSDDAKADDEVVKELYRNKVIGSYDAAIIDKDGEGKVHVHKREKPTQHGAEIGAAAGVVAGILFPPFLLADAAIGAVAGGLIGHMRKGMSNSEMKELGDALAGSEAALIVVGESRLEEALQKETKRATKTIEKEVTKDADEFNKEVEAAVKETSA